MRAALLASIVATVTPVSAAGMLPVPLAEAWCGKSDGYCYEWKIARDPSLRFIATGYEDGGGFYFYRRDAKGNYQLLFGAYPAMLDPKYPGQVFWGYAWDIRDIVISKGGQSLDIQAAFHHKHSDDDDGNWSPPPGQRAVPYVLFTGVATQPEIKVKGPLRFSRMSVEAVRRRSMANPSLEPTRVGKPPLAAELQR